MKTVQGIFNHIISFRGFLIAVILFMVSAVPSFAQDYVIETDETWNTDQTWSTNVIVKNGATLTIEKGVNVNIHFVDIDGDNKGDISITVEDGGRIILNGTIDEPVIFNGAGMEPASGIYWEGIVLEEQTEAVSRDILNFVTINDANNGLNINRPVQLNSPVFDRNLQSASIENDNVVLASPVIDGSGIIVNGNNVEIYHATITNAPGVAIELNGDNAYLDWADVDSSGSTGIVVNNGSATILNTSVKNSGGSGLFNNAGTVTIVNSDFSYNDYHGILTSEGSMDADSVTTSNNTNSGIVTAGSAGSNEFTNTSVHNNTGIGFVITSAAMTLDASTVTVGNDAGPTVKYNFSNIYGSDAVNGKQVQSYASTDVVADFTANWWGQGTGIGTLVDETNIGSVNYINWRIDGQGAYTGAGADLNPTKTITITYPLAGDTYVTGDSTTVTWSTIGDVSHIIFVEDASPMAAPYEQWYVVPNTGSYTYVPSISGGSDAVISIKEYSADSSSVQTSRTITMANAGSITVNSPALNDVLYGGDQDTILWDADDDFEYVRIIINYGGSPDDTIAQSTPNDGEFVYTVGQFNDDAVTVDIEDLTGTTSGSSGNYYIEPQPVSEYWQVTQTNTSMQIYFDDVNFYNDDETAFATSDGGTTPYTGTVWVGAFYLNENGELRCAGKTVLRDYNDAGNPVATTPPTNTPAPFDITVYGDDPNTVGIIDGVPDGRTILWRVWMNGLWGADDPDYDSPEGDGNDRTAIVRTGGPNGTVDPAVEAPITFAGETVLQVDATNNEGYVDYIRGLTGQPVNAGIHLEGGWQLISSYVIPSNTTLGWQPETSGALPPAIINGGPEILTPTANDPDAWVSGEQGFYTAKNGPNFSYAQQDLTNAFRILKTLGTDVHWNVNGDGTNAGATIQIATMTNWDYRTGYYINMMPTPASGFTYSAEDSLRLYGPKITPEATPLTVNPGWQIIPYWRDTDTNIAVALSTIAQYLRIVKDDQGNVYWPAFSINDIGDMEVGEGYLLYMYQSDQLIFPANAGSGPAPGQDSEGGSNTVSADPTHYVVDFNSDNSLTIGIREEALSEFVSAGDELGVFSSDGVLVGSKVYEGGNVALNAWGLESISDKGRGLLANEEYEIRVWKAKDNTEYVLTGLSFEEGNRYYKPMGIYIVNGVQGIENTTLPTEFSMSQNYPNPFNPSTTINFALPTDSRVEIVVYNILGEKVSELINTELKAGYHKVTFNATQFASGIYFYRLQAGEFVSVKKMNLLK